MVGLISIINIVISVVVIVDLVKKWRVARK